ncbi:uncharacterized protein [Asterias amurensis]|uniref:uncharacterized protein n=1 Tax=Asterias amurensis TaxID=7602 RepID=UPI003AB4388A
MDKFLTLTVLLLLVLAVASNPLESKRKSKCRGGTVGTSGGCQNNTSFFKRLFDEYKRGQVEEADTLDRRDWDLDVAEPNYQKKSNEFENEEEKLRILTEILEELELEDSDLK